MVDEHGFKVSFTKRTKPLFVTQVISTQFELEEGEDVHVYHLEEIPVGGGGGGSDMNN